MKCNKTYLFIILLIVGFFACSTISKIEYAEPATSGKGANIGVAKFGKMMRGIPDVLLPQNLSSKKSSINERYKIVKSGDRNLIEKPFDYRSPFTLSDPPSDIYEYNRTKPNQDFWPLTDDMTKPFNYYINDKVVIGLTGGPENATIDAFGTIRSYSGAYGFAQSDGSCFNLRIRTLEDGYLPIVKARVEKHGLEYDFDYFGAEIKDSPFVTYPRSKANFGEDNIKGRNIFLSASCKITNSGNENASTSLLFGYDERSMLPAGAVYSSPDYNGAWSNVKLEKNTGGIYHLLGVRNNTEYTLAIVKTEMEFQITDEVLTHWPLMDNPTVDPLVQFPENPTALTLKGKHSLANGKSVKVSILIPMFPLKREDDSFLAEQDASKLRREIKEVWQKRKAKLAQFKTPEAKVDNTLYTALNNLDICAVFNGDYKYPTPGPSGGHHIFYGRDSGDMIYAYDLMGDHETAANMLNMYRGKGGGPESTSIYIWALERHYAITRDKQWLIDNFDIIESCMNSLIDLWNKHKDQNSGLYPIRQLHDNEYIKDRYVGTHLYVASSAKRAYRLADILGKSELSFNWRKFHETFSDIVQNNLEITAQGTGGVITPGFSGYDAPSFDADMPYAHYGDGGGCDWHNLGALYPIGFFEPKNKLNRSSYDRWRHCYVEGLFPYARRQGNYSHLHGYNGMNLSESFLRDDMYAEALRDMYGILLHTSSTHAAAEQIVSQSRADMPTTPMGTSPHNWFSGKIISLIRNMLVYEQETTGELYLLAGMSPAWMIPGKSIKITDVPTTLGKISMNARIFEERMDIELDFKPYPEAKVMVLKLPPFVTAKSIKADGKSINIDSENRSSIPLGTKKVIVEWSGYPWPNISYKEVVDSYLIDYNKRVAFYRKTNNK